MKIKMPPGISIRYAALKAVSQSIINPDHEPVEFDFNGIQLTASAISDPRDIVEIYYLKLKILELESGML